MKEWRAYPEYKDSGVEWLGEIPEHWDIRKLKYISSVKFSNVDKKVAEGEIPVSLCNYVDVYYNDYITPELDFMEATASTNEIDRFTLREGDVIITKDSETWDDIAVPAYVPSDLPGVLCGYHLAMIRADITQVNCEYLFRSFSSYGINYQYRVEASGVTRYGLGKYWLDNSIFLLPPRDEQRAIASFLDRETERIDALVEKKERQIELLQEKRAALISHVVTRGLNPDAPMKDSGIPWLGEIPEHWDEVRSKAVFYEIKERSESGVEELLTVSHITGVTTRSSKQVSMFMAESLEGYKKCITGDLVINTMWAWMGALGIAFQCGVVSPSYNVYRFRQLGYEPRYYDRLFRTGSFVSEINRYSQGVWKSRLRLYPEEFFLIRIPRPPKNEQCAIADFLDQETKRIDTLIEKVEESIEKLREYRTALISAAVTGKIDVRGEVA